MTKVKLPFSPQACCSQMWKVSAQQPPLKGPLDCTSKSQKPLPSARFPAHHKTWTSLQNKIPRRQKHLITLKKTWQNSHKHALIFGNYHIDNFLDNFFPIKFSLVITIKKYNCHKRDLSVYVTIFPKIKRSPWLYLAKP